jgi:hypothetical protein
MNKSRRLPPIFYLIFTIIIIVLGNQIWRSITQSPQNNLTDRYSMGERLLVKENDSAEKRSGIKSFADGNYDAAI